MSQNLTHSRTSRPSLRACLVAGTALAGLVGSVPFAHAQTFNANTAFLNFNTGSGPWTTGYEATAGSSLVLYDVFADNGTFLNYHSSVVFSLGTPTFEKNETGSSQFTVPSGGIALHPGPNNEYSVIRFTVPTTNTYTINSQFFRATVVTPTPPFSRTATRRPLCFSRPRRTPIRSTPRVSH